MDETEFHHERLNKLVYISVKKKTPKRKIWESNTESVLV
jgi:hypothetical protein